MTKLLEQEIKDILSQPDSLKWVPLSALKSGEYVSCIDGRHANCIIATPGGDLGIFVSVMTAIEAQHPPLDRAFVERALDLVMEWHSRFYMHTDEFAVDALIASVHSEAPIHLPPGTTAIDFMRKPPRSHQELIRARLTDPAYVGCGFIKSMLEDPTGFGVRREIVEWAVVGFYDRLWNGSSNTRFEVLRGEHQERAVLYLDTKSRDESSTAFVPAIRGIKDGPSHLFVNHRPAREFLAHESLRLLANAGVLPTTIGIDEAIQFIDTLCDAQLERVLQMLAPDLPRYDIVFDHLGDRPEISKRT